MTDSGKEADWTVMVYLAGDNNLTAECIYALTEMKKVKTGGRINIIAQFDPQDDYLPTRRFEISSDPKPGKLLNNDLGGAPFEVESIIALLRAKARIAGLKAGATAATKAALASFKAALASLNENSETASGKFTIADRKLEKSFQFDLSGDGTLSSEIENERERETDTGSPTTLYNFLSYCVANFKAKHYMVVLSGHGSGTERDFLLRDESPEGYLTFNELRRVFEDLKPELGPGRMIDILGLDSCLMSMAEVCYELKGLVQILIGSESFSPASGWPYREVLQRLVWETENIKQNDEKDLQTRVAKGIVEEYVNFYADYWLGGISVDQSALDVTKVGYLKDHIDKLAKALTDEFEGSEEQREKFVNALIIAHWEAQSYNGEQFVDLADFCRCLSKRYNVERITGPCRALANLITPSLIVGQNGTLEDKPPAPEDKKTEAGTFVLKSCFSGPVFQYSYGVSIYFPWASVTPDYHELSFVKDTKDNKGSDWSKFLQTYTEETRRSPRNVTLADVAIDNFSSSNTTLRPQRFRKVEGKGAENPVYSMRNPPLIVIPDFCIEERESIINGMKKILAEDERSKRTQERARNANDADHSADDS